MDLPTFLLSVFQGAFVAAAVAKLANRSDKVVLILAGLGALSFLTLMGLDWMDHPSVDGVVVEVELHETLDLKEVSVERVVRKESGKHFLETETSIGKLLIALSVKNERLVLSPSLEGKGEGDKLSVRYYAHSREAFAAVSCLNPPRGSMIS